MAKLPVHFLVVFGPKTLHGHKPLLAAAAGSQVPAAVVVPWNDPALPPSLSAISLCCNRFTVPVRTCCFKHVAFLSYRDLQDSLYLGLKFKWQMWHVLPGMNREMTGNECPFGECSPVPSALRDLQTIVFYIKILYLLSFQQETCL